MSDLLVAHLAKTSPADYALGDIRVLITIADHMHVLRNPDGSKRPVRSDHTLERKVEDHGPFKASAFRLMTLTPGGFDPEHTQHIKRLRGGLDEQGRGYQHYCTDCRLDAENPLADGERRCMDTGARVALIDAWDGQGRPLDPAYVKDGYTNPRKRGYGAFKVRDVESAEVIFGKVNKALAQAALDRKNGAAKVIALPVLNLEASSQDLVYPRAATDKSDVFTPRRRGPNSQDVNGYSGRADATSTEGSLEENISDSETGSGEAVARSSARRLAPGRAPGGEASTTDHSDSAAGLPSRGANAAPRTPAQGVRPLDASVADAPEPVVDFETGEILDPAAAVGEKTGLEEKADRTEVVSPVRRQRTADQVRDTRRRRNATKERPFETIVVPTSREEIGAKLSYAVINAAFRTCGVAYDDDVRESVVQRKGGLRDLVTGYLDAGDEAPVLIAALIAYISDNLAGVSSAKGLRVTDGLIRTYVGLVAADPTLMQDKRAERAIGRYEARLAELGLVAPAVSEG